MAKEINVAVGILVERDARGWRLFITRRPDDAVLGGYWELPGGKIETGEAVYQCLSREFSEEVGLTVRVGETLPVIEHRYDHGYVRLHPCWCERIEGEPRNLQVAEHRWVRPEEFGEYCFPPANAGLMEVIREKLREKK